MKKSIFLLCILLIAFPLFGKYVKRGAIICNNLNSILKLQTAIDTPNFWNVWQNLTSTRQCSEVNFSMTDNGLIFKDLGNGITQIDNPNSTGHIFVFTREVHY